VAIRNFAIETRSGTSIQLDQRRTKGMLLVHTHRGWRC